VQIIGGSPDEVVRPDDSVAVDDTLVLWLIKRLWVPSRPASASRRGKFWAEASVTNF
jgi:hypothetical protein